MGYGLTDDIGKLFRQPPVCSIRIFWCSIFDWGLRSYAESAMDISGCESSGQGFLMPKSYAQHLHLVYKRKKNLAVLELLDLMRVNHPSTG